MSAWKAVLRSLRTIAIGCLVVVLAIGLVIGLWVVLVMIKRV